MAIQFTTPGWYIIQVDTGIGEQHGVVQILQASDLDRLSSHYKQLKYGPEATPEEAWGGFWKSKS
jgi:hypothetical protein